MINFWIAPALRFLVLSLTAGVAFMLFGPVSALCIFSAGLFALVIVQLRYLDHLRRWLKSPDEVTIPDGWGAWGEVFSELYRAHRRETQGLSRLADALRRSELAAQALPDGVVLIDGELRIDWCNGAAERMLGISRINDRGNVLTNLVRYPGLAAYLARATRESDEPGLLIETSGNAPSTLSIQVVQFAVEDKVVLLRDVTTFERTERIRRDFIANVSHELRTPLTVVNGYLEHLLGGDIDPAMQSRAVDVMFAQAQRMSRLVEDLLVLSRLEADGNPLHEDMVNVPKMIDVLIEEARAYGRGRHHIVAQVAPISVFGSADELRSAFTNLMSNAVRYTPEGGTIQVSWQAAREGGGVVFSVTDSGIGIAAEHIPRLTERFYRVDRSRSRETGGTGLGLAIVKHVLLRHQGALEIESELGQGATFRCRLPAGRVHAAEDAELSAP